MRVHAARFGVFPPFRSERAIGSRSPNYVRAMWNGARQVWSRQLHSAGHATDRPRVSVCAEQQLAADGMSSTLATNCSPASVSDTLRVVEEVSGGLDQSSRSNLLLFRTICARRS
jgi:hypothetical protein